MSGLVYTSDSLLISIRNLALAANAKSSGTDDSDLLRHSTEVMWTKMCPYLMRIREDYFVVSERVALSANQPRYRIPSRAMLLKLRSLWRVNGSGERSPIDPIQRERLNEFGVSGGPSAYYIEGSDVVLVPSSSGSGSLEFSYYSRPGALVLTSAARQVVSVNLSAKTITFATAAASTFVSGAKLDIHSQESGAELKVWNVTQNGAPSGVGNVTITITEAIDGSVFGTKAVAAGDWVCLSEEAVIPGVPKEFHPMIALAVAQRLNGSAGDIDVAKMLGMDFAADGKNMLSVAEARNEGAPMRIIGRRGILRRIRRG